MKLFLRHEVQAQEARKTKDRRRSGDRRRARLQVEPLEGRQLLSWGSVAVPPATAHALAPLDPIQAEYAATAFERDAYGNVVQKLLGPSNPKYETNVPGVPGAKMEKYNDNGVIYWSPSTGAHVVYGAIGAEYAALAHETDAYGRDAQLVLGLPTSDEMNVPGVSGARMNTFQGGAIYWSPSTGAHVVYGAIGAEYAALAHETDAYGRDAQLVLGLPTSDEMNVPGVSGARMNTFQGGAIYWSPSTGAHVVYGAIGAEYAALAHETDAYGRDAQLVLGLPTSDEMNVPGVSGARMNTFQGGAIYWSPSTGAHVVYGAIGAEYAALAHETDAYGRDAQLVLGLPTSDEMNVPGVSGARMNTFQDGAIYWSPSTGAHVVYGAIGAEYAALAHETDAYGRDAQLVLGLPTSDEMNVPGVSGARMNTFQGGAIYWSPSTGAHVVYGAIGAEYAALAHETDAYGRDAQLVLGLPTSDEMNVPGVSGARMNTFQGGAIYWSPSTGAHVVYGAIGSLYNSLGGPTSFLGLPISDELGIPGGRVSYFQKGEIVWTPQGGAYAV